MKKLALAVLTAVAVVCLTASAFAGGLAPGASTSCNDAKSITLEASGSSSAGDRGNANAVIWKSSNATTVPIALGPADNNAALHGSDKGHEVGLSEAKFYGSKPGSKTVTLSQQSSFSRGDSIGDISGLVKITNHGTNPVTVTCN